MTPIALLYPTPYTRALTYTGEQHQSDDYDVHPLPSPSPPPHHTPHTHALTYTGEQHQSDDVNAQPYYPRDQQTLGVRYHLSVPE